MCLEDEKLHSKVVSSIAISTLDNETKPSAVQLSKYSGDVLPKHYPHIITIERLETLLRQVGEIFPKDSNVSFTSPSTFNEQNPLETELNQEMQPPINEPYNFYLPQYEHDLDLHAIPHQAKLDSTSRKLVKIIPPPLLLSKGYSVGRYYNLKTKKIPKKFDGTLKNINYKWSKFLELKPEPYIIVEEKTTKKTNVDPMDLRNDANFITTIKNQRQHNHGHRTNRHQFKPDSHRAAQIPTMMPTSVLRSDQQEFYFTKTDVENPAQQHSNSDDSFFAIAISVPQESNNRIELANQSK